MNYYIPCYDIQEKEIYFIDFFTEEMITQPKEEEILIKNEDSFNEKDKDGIDTNKKEKDVDKKEKEIIDKKEKEEEEKQQKELTEEQKKIKWRKETLEICLKKFELNWKKMQVLSAFNKQHYISKNYEDYFRRPLYSRFFIPQNLQLYSYNSCVPLPNVIASYSSIPVKVKYHLDSLLGWNEDKETLDKIRQEVKNKIDELNKTASEEKRQVNNYIQKEKGDPIMKEENAKESQDLNKSENIDQIIRNKLEEKCERKNISFLCIIDTLIQDYVATFEKKLKSLKNEIDAIDKYIERFQEYKKNKAYKFILKVAGAEEYLYGDYTLGSYDFVRGKVRQHEHIELILKRIPFYKVQPPLFNFPPIIRMKSNEVSYENLIDNYFELYPEFQIIYRLYRPKPEQMLRYLKQKVQRTEMLTKFTESGDCDFHLHLKICGLNNLDGFKEWFQKRKETKSELIFPFVDPIKKLEIKKRNFFSQMCTTICSCFGKKKENQAEKQQEEKEFNDKLISKHENKKEENNTIENDLNTIKIKSDYDQKDNLIQYSSLIRTPLILKRVGNNNIFHSIVKYLSDIENNITESSEQGKGLNLKDNKKVIEEKFTKFTPNNIPQNLPIPVYIRVKIELLYGCFSLRSLMTEPFLFSNSIIINERIILDTVDCLISHLPFETRIGVSIVAYDQRLEQNLSFVLGSCQIPLYKDNGEMQSGKMKYELWPNVEIYPRVNTSTPFSLKQPQKYEKKEEIISEDTKAKYNLEIKELSKLSPDFTEMKNIQKKETEFKILREEREKEKYLESIKREFDQKKKQEDYYNFSILKDEPEISSIPEEKKKSYPSITLEFPKFASPIIHTIQSCESYRQFLKIKYNNSQEEQKNNDYSEIRKLFGNSQIEIRKVISGMKESSNKKIITITKPYNSNIDQEYPTDIWQCIQKNLPNIIKILKKDPLEKLEKKDINAILICRDYISTIPSALELFLRAIDWKNPFEVSIAHLYLKKWTPIEGEDAVSLLDARFPDTAVREYAVSILRGLPDEMISAYMLMLCQCLLYETFLVNPLADFLIERSLMNPKLLGNSFMWNCRINKQNPLFAERLSAYLLQLLMVGGDKFLQYCFDGLICNYYLELMAYEAKKVKAETGNTNLAEFTVLKFIDYLNEEIFKSKKFSFPINPTFFGTLFTEDIKAFKSKMVPIRIGFCSREPTYRQKLIFKIGDDLRQDVLTIQMLKIMDKLWLDNNLDLKLLSYKVCPTEVNAGFVECVIAQELAEIQKNSGLGGALDRELIIKYLRGTSVEKQSSEDEQANKTDNFIKSLAGYCVATCVLGVADRHSSNVMIQENGLFLHIDFGHILGNFKYKFGVKRERSLFLLTPEMANVYVNDKKEEQFKRMCAKAFNILRHNAAKLMNSFIIMSTSGMPEFFGICDIKYMKQMLVLDKPNDEDAGNYFIEQIRKTRNEKFRQIDNIIHNIKQ